MRHSIFPALAATEAEALQEIYSRTARRKVIEVIKATTEGLDYNRTQREGTSEIIARWMNLNQAQAANTYVPGRDALSRAGIPTDEQAKPYIAMLGTTAGLKRDISAVISIFLSPTRRQKNSRGQSGAVNS